MSGRTVSTHDRVFEQIAGNGAQQLLRRLFTVRTAATAATVPTLVAGTVAACRVDAAACQRHRRPLISRRGGRGSSSAVVRAATAGSRRQGVPDGGGKERLQEVAEGIAFVSLHLQRSAVLLSNLSRGGGEVAAKYRALS